MAHSVRRIQQPAALFKQEWLQRTCTGSSSKVTNSTLTELASQSAVAMRRQKARITCMDSPDFQVSLPLNCCFLKISGRVAGLDTLRESDM